MSFDGLNVIFLCVGKGSRLKSRFMVPPDELLIKDEHRMVMFALADAPLTLEGLCAKLGVKRDAVESVLKTLVNANLVKRICGKYAMTILYNTRYLYE
ncbi:MAG: MarR family transcriptional regulator [Thermoprotei archaeon]|nr:MarR family transcriptional regulator [Thermoprotei archaeon]